MSEPREGRVETAVSISAEKLFVMLQEQQKLMAQQQEQQWAQQQAQQQVLGEMLKQQKWPESVWATQLAGLLTGKARQPTLAEEAGNYKIVKKTILHRYDVTHHLRFRRDKKKWEESYREWICRITDHFEKWMKDAGIDLRELIIMKQVLSETPEDLAVCTWLRERRPWSLEELGELAENYTQARKGEDVGRTGSWRSKSGQEKGTGLKGERLGTSEGSRTKVNSRGEKQCYHCRHADNGNIGQLNIRCPHCSGGI